MKKVIGTPSPPKQPLRGGDYAQTVASPQLVEVINLLEEIRDHMKMQTELLMELAK